MTSVTDIAVDVIRRIPHDSEAFTQGFATAGSSVYESTGEYGRSEIREVDMITGEIHRSAALQDDRFGEGVAVVGDTIWQLTWREHVAIEWDRATLTARREVPVDGEGWGLCFDGSHLVQSDGTDVIRFRDPVTFAQLWTISVTSWGQPVAYINDLTFFDGHLWANVLHFDTILRIDPSTGEITGAADASRLLPAADRARAHVFNGITASGHDTVLVSGKRWPFAFEVRLREKPGSVATWLAVPTGSVISA